MILYNKRFKFLVIILFILIVSCLFISQDGVKDFFYSKSLPIQEKFWDKGYRLSNIWKGFSNAEDLKLENQALRDRNQELLSENNFLEQLREENEILRNALDIGLEEKFKISLAEIVNVDFLRDYILINKGSEEGLAEGMTVINEQKVLLGKISEVSSNFSRVILISDQDSFFPVEIKGKEITATIKGKGGYLLSLQEIPREKEIEERDVVITTSLGGDFPEGLLVGEVKSIKRSDVEDFQSGEIVPFFSIETIKKVFVVTNF